MIETVTEYYELLERLRDKNFNGELSKHLQSKLEAFQECEELINTLAIHSLSNRLNETTLEEINTILWESHMIKSRTFDRTQGNMIMKELEKWAKR